MIHIVLKGGISRLASAQCSRNPKSSTFLFTAGSAGTPMTGGNYPTTTTTTTTMAPIWRSLLTWCDVMRIRDVTTWLDVESWRDVTCIFGKSRPNIYFFRSTWKSCTNASVSRIRNKIVGSTIQKLIGKVVKESNDRCEVQWPVFTSI